MTITSLDTRCRGRGLSTLVTLSLVSELPQPAPFEDWQSTETTDEPEPEPEPELELEVVEDEIEDEVEPAGEFFLCVLRTIVRKGVELDSPQAKLPFSFLEVGQQVVGVEVRKTDDGIERVRLEDGGWVSRVSKLGRPILMSESEFFAPADADHDGVVSKDEFVVWHLHALGTPPTADDYAMFYAADKNGDGTVSQQEFAECQPLFLDAQRRAEAKARAEQQTAHLRSLVAATAKMHKIDLLELAEPSKRIIHLDVEGHSLAEVKVRKRISVAPFYTNTDHFPKTGSGQT